MQEQLKNVQQIQATSYAVAAVLGDGSVVIWGDADYGGDSRALQDELKNVQHIQGASYVFVAVLGDGSVVTWGDCRGAGDSSALQNQVKKCPECPADPMLEPTPVQCCRFCRHS